MRRLIATVVSAALVLTGIGAPPIVAATPATKSAPTLRAVVIGAAGYDPTVAPPLVGAFNDATFIADSLIRDGAKPEDVTLLVDVPATAADGQLRAATTKSDGPATRDNILGALKQLVAVTKPGDEIVISFSGHGEQQPEAVAGNEPDGLDEVFLPLDFSQQGPDQKYGKAILDDDISAAIDAVRAKGGNVTYLADFCHSGDSNRGSADGPAVRPKEPYGSPIPKIAALGSGPFKADLGLDLKPGAAGRGAYVGFLAAPSDTRAKQDQAPKFAPAGQAKPMGLVSAYTMVNLTNPRVYTYRDLAARVNSNIDLHASAPRPLFDGDLDRPVFGGLLKTGDAAAKVSWTALKPLDASYTGGPVAIKSLNLSAGALQGVTPGSVIALALPGADGDKTVLYGKVDSVDAYSAVLVPATYGGIDAATWNDAKDLRGRPLSAQTKFVATIEQQPVALDFRIALPAAGSNGAQKAASTALSALTAADVGAELVPAGQKADLVLAFAGDTLTFADPSGTPTTDFGKVDLAPLAKAREPALAMRKELGEALVRAVRFNRLRRVVAAIGQGDPGPGAVDAAKSVDVAFYREAGKANPDGTCADTKADFYAVGPAAQAVTGAEMQFRRCDWLYVKITNKGDQELYVNPLIFSPDGGILALQAKQTNPTRFAPKESGVLQYSLVDAVPGGALRDDLVVLVMGASDGLAVDFGRLAQCPVVPGAEDGAACARAASLTLAGTKLRGGAGGGTSVEDYIDSTLNGGALRSGTPSTPLRASALRFSWQTVGG